jgi:spore maturation protein SpmB
MTSWALCTVRLLTTARCAIPTHRTVDAVSWRVSAGEIAVRASDAFDAVVLSMAALYGAVLAECTCNAVLMMVAACQVNIVTSWTVVAVCLR